MASARIARGFYPVVVPANIGAQPRYGRAKAKANGAGKGKEGNQLTAKRKPPSKISKKGKPPGMASGSATTGGIGKSGDKSRPAPICFRCGKKCHLSRNCTHVPNGKEADDSH